MGIICGNDTQIALVPACWICSTIDGERVFIELELWTQPEPGDTEDSHGLGEDSKPRLVHDRSRLSNSRVIVFRWKFHVRVSLAHDRLLRLFLRIVSRFPLLSNIIKRYEMLRACNFITEAFFSLSLSLALHPKWKVHCDESPVSVTRTHTYFVAENPSSVSRWRFAARLRLEFSRFLAEMIRFPLGETYRKYFVA